MDPVSHAILGRVLTTAADPAAGAARGVAAASILGALSPDVDFLLMPVGWDVYLRAHEIGTHSAGGLIVTGLLSAGLVRMARRGSRYRVLAAAAVAGAASHVAADIVSGARIRLAWPLAEAIPSAPLVAMGDPWPIAILAGGALALWRLPVARRRFAATSVLVLLVAFFCLKALLLTAAFRTFDVKTMRSSDRVVEAGWASLFEWHVFDRTPDAVRHWRIVAGGGPPEIVLSWPIAPEPPLVSVTRHLDTVRNFLHVHDLGFAVQQPVNGGQLAVLWSDIRFCRKGDSAAAPIACALWFGGVLDRDGRVVRQEVRVGSWIQDRPPPAAFPPR